MSGPTPSQTVGPYFTMRIGGEGENVLTTPETAGERIRVEGFVYDGDRKHIEDALIELWQANAAGRYQHPADDRDDVPLDPAFTGFGRCPSDFKTGAYSFLTIKPGPVPHPNGGLQAPHLSLIIQARGMLDPTYTRVVLLRRGRRERDRPSARHGARRPPRHPHRRKGGGRRRFRRDVSLRHPLPGRRRDRFLRRLTMSIYPGFSTDSMDTIWSADSRVAAMLAVESAVAVSQAEAGDIPRPAAEAIVEACLAPVSPDILAEGWTAGTPVLPLLDAVRSRLDESAAPHLHHRLTTQDVVDSSAMILARAAVTELSNLAARSSDALRAAIERYGDRPTQARSFLQPASETTFGFRAGRWLTPLDRAHRTRVTTPASRCSSAGSSVIAPV